MAEQDIPQDVQEELNKHTVGDEQTLLLQSTFVKDMSFEAPNSPDIFLEEYKPKIDVQIASSSKKLQDDIYEVTLKATVTSKVGEKTAYISEAEFGGVFTVKGVSDELRTQILKIFCPEQLYPYLRETISETIAKGGFPRFLMAPVNFAAMYQQGMQQQANKGEANA